MISFTFNVEDTKLRAQLDSLPIVLMAKLLPTIEGLTRRLLEGVRAAEPMRTGRLRAATRSQIDSGPTYIRGRVSIGPREGIGGHNVAAAALEYGVHKVEHVGAHRERRDGEFVAVEAYTRRVSIAARRFLRGPLERMRPIAESEIRAALAEALK
jgi:hypothetical protein